MTGGCGCPPTTTDPECEPSTSSPTLNLLPGKANLPAAPEPGPAGETPSALRFKSEPALPTLTLGDEENSDSDGPF